MMSKDDVERKILTTLSMNSRATLKFIGSQIGLSKHPTFRKVKKAEEKYKINYIAELDINKLGFLKFLILVKFTGRIPPQKDIAEAARKEPRIQLGLLLNGGQYDLLLYALAETDSAISKIRLNLIRDPLLINYPAEWYVSPFDETYNFVPLTDEFVESLRGRIMERIEIGKQTKGKEKRILMREFAVLKEINKNANIDFVNIDKKYGFDRGRSQYSFYKLLDKGLIKRTTITMHDLPIKYSALIIGKITNYKAFEEERPRLLHHIIRDSNSITNRYALTGDITIPFSILFFMPSIKTGDVDEVLEDLNTFPGIEFTTSIITNTLIGEFCYRLFDNAYSIQSDVLEYMYKEKTQKKIEYYGGETKAKKENVFIELPNKSKRKIKE